MSRTVRVSAPSRLHFGLWSLGGTGRQFGGVGAMIEKPGLTLEISAAARFSPSGALAERVDAFARRWAEFHRVSLSACRLQVIEAPPQHVGLGTGTQLALAVAAGLNAWSGFPAQTPLELAVSVGRGQRSAVGTHGFVLGGLIVEQGKLPGEPVSPLDCRVAIPDEWRFVLARPAGLVGLAGQDEAAAIAKLDEIPSSTREQLVAEARERLIPATACAEFPAFAESLYRYGNLAGHCFSSRQLGPYNGPVLTALVERIRSLGHTGVGQSSWGPTLYVATESAAAAEQLAVQVRSLTEFGVLTVDVTAPCNTGARIEVIDD